MLMAVDGIISDVTSRKMVMNKKGIIEWCFEIRRVEILVSIFFVLSFFDDITMSTVLDETCINNVVYCEILKRTGIQFDTACK